MAYMCPKCRTYTMKPTPLRYVKDLSEGTRNVTFWVRCDCGREREIVKFVNVNKRKRRRAKGIRLFNPL